MPVPLDPLSAAFFVAALVATARADGTSSGLTGFGGARCSPRPLPSRTTRLGTTITLPKAALLGVLLGPFDVPRLREIATDTPPAPLLIGALSLLCGGHRARHCSMLRNRGPVVARNAQDRRVCGILRGGVPLLHARPRRRAPDRRGGGCGDGRCAIGARPRNRWRAIRTLYRASHRAAYCRPPRRAEPTFGLLRDRRGDAGRLGARSILGAALA